MLFLVNGEGMPSDEIFPAPLTFERSLFSMDPLMVHKAIIPVVRFPTLITLVAFLAAVYALMVEQRPFPREGFPALLAPEWFPIRRDLWLHGGGDVFALVELLVSLF